MLYVVATPLGNLGDITLRALETLRSLEDLFVEDTRECQKLFEALEIPAQGRRFHSFAAHNMKEGLAKALELLRSGRSVGLLTDRGTPAISDPGALLVRGARDAGFGVVPIPGVSSLSTILSVAGHEVTPSLFLGFLPTKGRERTERLDLIAKQRLSAVIFESPRRVKELIADLKAIVPGETKIVVGRELTKKFETIAEASLSDIESVELPEMGEYTIFVAPPSVAESAKGEETISAAVEERLLSDREWAKRMARTLGVASGDLYDALQKKKVKV